MPLDALEAEVLVEPVELVEPALQRLVVQGPQELEPVEQVLALEHQPEVLHL